VHVLVCRLNEYLTSRSGSAPYGRTDRWTYSRTDKLNYYHSTSVARERLKTDERLGLKLQNDTW